MSAELDVPLSPAIHDHGDPTLEKQDDLRRLIVRGGAMLVGSRLLMQIVSWAVTLLVARLLSPYDYGVITTGGIFLGMGDLLAEAGVGKALVQKSLLTEDDLAESFTLSFALALVLYAVIFCSSGAAASFFRNADLASYLRVAGLLLFLIPFRSVPLAILERRFQMGRQAAVHIASGLIQAGVNLALAVGGWGFWSLLAGTAGARVVESSMLSSQAGWSPRFGPPRLAGGGLASFGAHVSAASLLWYAYSNSDFVVVGKLGGPAELGYYSLAFGLISLPVQKLTVNLNQVAYPFYCRLQHDPERLKGWYLRLTSLVGFVALPAMVGMALVAEDGITMALGRKWAPAVLPFQLLSIVGVFMVFGSSLPPLLNALGRPDVNSRYSMCCMFAYPLAFVLSGARYGMVGVCAAWVAIYPMALYLFFSLTRSITRVGPYDLVRSQSVALASTLIMVPSVFLVNHWAGAAEPPLVRFASSVAAGVASYGLGVLLLGRGKLAIELRAVRDALTSGRPEPRASSSPEI